MLARGATIRQAAERLELARSTVFDLAKRADLPRRRAGLPPDKEAAIARLARHNARSIRQIAREAGVSQDAVARRVCARLREIVGKYGKTRKWRCRCGLLLVIKKCVRCGAEREPSRTNGHPSGEP